MGHHEKIWLDTYSGPKILFYRRYVDDTFCLFNTERDAKDFFNYINSKHPCIRFTMEKEVNNTLPFLDIEINNSNAILTKTTVFRKKTFVGLFTNFLSFSPTIYKTGLVKTLIDRVYRINNTWVGFHQNMKKVKEYLSKNSFPTREIDKLTDKNLSQ